MVPVVAGDALDVDVVLVYDHAADQQPRLMAAKGRVPQDEVDAVDVSAVASSQEAEILVPDCLANRLIAPQFARSIGIKSAVLYRIVIGCETFVVLLGAKDQRFANGAAGRDTYSKAAINLVTGLRADRKPAIRDTTPLASMVREITEAVERITSLEGLIERINELIRRALAPFDPRAHGSIWLVEDRRGLSDGRSELVLHCRNVISREETGPSELIRPFGTGLVGWVAEHRTPVHVLIGDLAEVLPDGTPVMKQYLPWKQTEDRTRAELTVPMLYAGRLVGVLNLERPEAQRFPPEFLLTVQLLALHSAQAIQRQRIDRLYSQILGEGDITKLSEMVIREASQLIEAPLACIYLWNIDTQQLLLEATTAPIVTRSGKRIGLKMPCYESPGVGLTRWAFDQKLWLKIEDLSGYSEPTHRDFERHRDDVLHQILVQALGSEKAKEAIVETIQGTGEDRRPFWRITAPGCDVLDVPQPIWSQQYRFEPGVSKSMIVLPVMDARENGPVLGVMLFSRLDDRPPLSESDVPLLQSLAKQIAQALLRTQTARALAMERCLLSQVVRMEPTHWKDEFQHRLRERLAEMRRVLRADLIVVRMLEKNELALVAHDPSETAFERAWGTRIRIPTTLQRGIGGSGQAAALKRSFHIPNQQHPDSIRGREQASQLGEEGNDVLAFLSRVHSVTAVPLIVGDQVIGVLTAASQKPTQRRIFNAGGTWCSEFQGVQEDHADYLNYHARWLGPALETLGALVKRSRQLSSLSIAVRKLTESVPRSGIDRSKRLHSDRIHYAAMVVATHHDGLGFHQAFVATCTEDVDQQKRVIRLSGKDQIAWGAFNTKEQNVAHAGRSELKGDIDAAISMDNLCEAIQKEWSSFFEIELPYLPEAPCLFVRDGLAAKYPSNLRVAVHRAPEGGSWDKLLNFFCDLFNIPRSSEAAHDLVLGMVNLGRRNNRVNEVMFVTNVGFRMEGGGEVAYVDPMPIESIDVLDDLGVILTLAGGVQDLDNKVRRYQSLKRKARMKLNEIKVMLGKEKG
jgi:GAF domain-containing protein